jgi:hypothetical protein
VVVVVAAGAAEIARRMKEAGQAAATYLFEWIRKN